MGGWLGGVGCSLSQFMKHSTQSDFSAVSSLGEDTVTGREVSDCGAIHSSIDERCLSLCFRCLFSPFVVFFHKQLADYLLSYFFFLLLLEFNFWLCFNA